MSYKLLVDGGVLRIEDKACIPSTTDNADWLVYQKWLAAGNAPLPADPALKLSPKSLSDGDLAAVLVAKQILTQQDVTPK